MPRAYKLTQIQIDEIISAYTSGESANLIGKRYDITLHAVRYHARKAGVWEGIRAIPLESRFWSKVRKTNKCWIWTGAKFRQGYGCISIHGASTLAHRIAYEIANGPIPFDLTIDHLCRNKSCVNPDHLEAVTMGINTKRGRDALGMKYELKK